jgi:hypothetical protein
VFAATVNFVVPDPLSVAPLVMVIHASFDRALQLHEDADAVTATDPDPPPSATSTLVGEIENVHGGGAAACVTVKVFPATAMVPVRAAPVLAATVNATMPFPDPDAPDETTIQLATETAVHAQPAVVVTAIVPLPPPATMFWPEGAIANVQDGCGGVGVGGSGVGAGGSGVGAGAGGAGVGGVSGTADCSTVTFWSAIDTVPVRPGPAFGAMVRTSAPVRFPLEDCGSDIQAASLDAAQAHPVSVWTVTLSAPPAAGTAALKGDTLYRHGAASCRTVIVVLLTSTAPRR